MQASVIPIPAGEGAIGGAARPIPLARNVTAVFFLQWSQASGADCQDIEGIAFQAPGQQLVPTRVPFGIRFCGRLLRVSVVLPAGTS